MNWISLEDQLPPEDQDMLLYDGKEVFCGNYFEGMPGVQACDGICYGWYNKGPITHWMPLPKPPEEENELDKR